MRTAGRIVKGMRALQVQAGACMEATTRAIVEASAYPLSIIMVRMHALS
jgi:hypothetical protein